MSSISFSFGDSPAMADELLALVLAGVKTASCGALTSYPEDERPVVGRRDIVLDGKGQPAAIIETVEVTIRRFDEVDEQLAHDEGEGMRTLAEWRAGHQAYFERNGGFTPDMELICERFRLVEALDPALPLVGRVANVVSGVVGSDLAPPPGPSGHPPRKGEGNGDIA